MTQIEFIMFALPAAIIVWGVALAGITLLVINLIDYADNYIYRWRSRRKDGAK